MFGHVGGCAAVLTAQRQALQQTQADQDDRRGHAYGRVAGQQAHHGRRDAHDHDGDEEGVLASDHVAQAAEHNGAERPDGEAGGEGEQGKDEGGCLVDAGEEVLGDNGGQRAIQIEVVPLEHGAQGRSEDHLALLLARRGGQLISGSRYVLGHCGSPAPCGGSCCCGCLS
ncbi:hypothetical protein D9M73_173910 [compost metagenome]